MRIIAGSLGGRTFASPRTHRTHPMSDKVRGALFNALGGIDGLTVLDAFAGSGALSFEAVSRGATSALAIESDRSAQQTIASNIADLHLQDNVKLIKASANAWLTTSDVTFDLVLADPPYDNLQPNLLHRLLSRVNPDGLFVLSWPGNQELPTFDAAKLVSQKYYGDAQLAFYQKIQ